MSDPCWNGGQISYWHFYMRSKGDGRLIKLYPNLAYLDHTPNSAELFTRSSIVLYVAMSLAMATVIANIAHDVYHHLWRDADRTRVLMSSLRGLGWVERGIFLFVRRRFDWFTGRAGDGPTNEERMNGRQRMVLVALSSLVCCVSSFAGTPLETWYNSCLIFSYIFSECVFAKCSLVYNIFVQQMKCTHPS
ncbi:uncharacterized protein EDB91DRAFT_1166354 [Suillus paluster]|uniref:uncharacterized protein n=1 Tax=Suillus paluster TaxID=48578 RepID=UPI001B861957|nr:uncharacterized protein EDB91DRAFT_1166354 [Suillus paluster]KAG1726340.1 hypothetical protein EDB91DRAFT_1166354 [Suillus paluster]